MVGQETHVIHFGNGGVIEGTQRLKLLTERRPEPVEGWMALAK